MTPNQLLVARLIDKPINEWGAYCDRLDAGDLQEPARRLSDLAQRATLAAAYVTERSNGTDPAKAARKSRVAVRRLRRALGYSYPDAGIVTP